MSDSVASDLDLRAAAARYERLLEVQEVLAAVARAVGPAVELERVLQIVLSALRSLLDVHGATVVLTGERGLHVAASDPPVPAEVATLRLPIGRGIAGRVVHSRRTIYSPDVRVDERVVDELREVGLDAAIVSCLAVPLVVLGDVIGVIEVYSSAVDAFDREDRILLEGVAAQVAGAIESARRFEQVAELEVLKSDFIARVSHELRTPITIVSGFVTTLLGHHDELTAESRRQMLERVEMATARLSGLIDELLMLSKLEAGVLAARREPVVLASLLDDARRQSASADTVTVACDPDLVIDTDPGLLLRALGFLLDNALKYAGAAELRGGPGTIEVVDHGPGIRGEAKARMFERFTRDTDLTTVPGMGIGLPMARTLLAAVGADLLLEDAPGGGTRIVVKFWD